MGVGGQLHSPTAFTPGKDPVPIIQEAGWAPGTVWTGAENLAPTGIRSPDLPARSESLYRLSYPDPQGCEGLWLFFEAKKGPRAKRFGKHCSVRHMS